MELLFWTILGSFAGVLVSITLKEKQKMVVVADIFLGASGAVLMGVLFDTIFVKNMMGFYDQTILLVVLSSGIFIWVGRSFVHKHAP